MACNRPHKIVMQDATQNSHVAFQANIHSPRKEYFRDHNSCHYRNITVIKSVRACQVVVKTKPKSVSNNKRVVNKKLGKEVVCLKKHSIKNSDPCDTTIKTR